MIYKGDFLDLLQARLSGGAVTNDTAIKYPIQDLEAIVSMAFASLLSSNPMMKREMAVPYTISPIMTAPNYKTPLDVVPYADSKGLVWVTGESEHDWYIIQDGLIGSKISSVLKPETGKVACYYDNGYMYFKKKPSETVTVYIVPNIHAMEDDQPLILQDKEEAFLRMCYDLCMNTSQRPMEQLDNGKADQG